MPTTALLLLALGASACAESPSLSPHASGPDGSQPSNDAAGASGIVVVITPGSVSLAPGATQTFACTVIGTTTTGCQWAVAEAAGGAITDQGVYTAPSGTGTFHIVATSSADARASSTATVGVTSSPIGACDKLAAQGTWENITPLSLNMSQWCAPYYGSCPQPAMTANGKIGTYGTQAFVLDPSQPGTIYLGTSSLGIWKSTDCGASWSHVDTGQNGATLDAGRNWSMVVDPTDPRVLYTVAGYGQGGVFKSTDGGVDWTQILPQKVLSVTKNGFIEKITMDPTNNLHLVVGFHVDCTGTPLPGATTDSTGGWGCLAESLDGGASWALTTSAIPWSGLDGPGQTLIDAKTWFYATNGGPGLWRTTTGGVSVGGQPPWTKVFAGSVNGSVYVSKAGGYYTGGVNVAYSADHGASWQAIAGSPSCTSVNGSTPMVDTGSTLYVGSSDAIYWTTADGAPKGPFTMISSTPSVPKGPVVEQAPAAFIDYDSAHHLLYSSNLDGGFWRIVVP